MAAFNVFLKEVTTNTWTAEGGTAFEALGRETAEPTQPATAKLCKSTTISQKIEAKLKLPAGLVTELEAGAKVIALTVHLNAKATAEEKRIKFGTVSPVVSSEAATPIAQTWMTVSLSKAQAEEQTQATLEALVLLIEHIKANSASVYELYASVETSAGSVVSGALAQQIGTVQATTASRAALGSAAQVSAAKQTPVGARAALGGQSQRTGLTQATSATRTARAGVTQRVAAVQRTASSAVQKAEGALRQAIALAHAATGARAASGGARQLAASSQAASGLKVAAGTLTQRAATTQQTAGITSRTGGMRQAAGVAQAASGVRRALGTIAQRVAVVQLKAPVELFRPRGVLTIVQHKQTRIALTSMAGKQTQLAVAGGKAATIKLIGS